MACNLLDVGPVNNEFLFADADRQQFADALPGNRIEVLQIGDVAFGIDRPVQDLRGVVGLCGQNSGCGFSSSYKSIGRRPVSRWMRTSAVSASQRIAIWLRCSSELNVRPLRRFVST
jgi:hypothetical protein